MTKLYNWLMHDIVIVIIIIIMYRCLYRPYQAFYGLKHYNLLETESFLIRKLNRSTSCLMLQFKGKNTLKLPFDSNFK